MVRAADKALPKAKLQRLARANRTKQVALQRAESKPGDPIYRLGDAYERRFRLLWQPGKHWHTASLSSAQGAAL